MLLAGVGLAAKKLRHVPPQQIEVQAEVQTEMRAEVHSVRSEVTSRGSFSAVSTPIFASKYALESSRRDLRSV
jgi:hypothetical protein